MSIIVSSGEMSSGVVISDGDSMFVCYSGTAIETTVDNYGYLYVSSGGTVNSATVNNHGYLRVSSGGTAVEIRENGGYVEVADGADATFVHNVIHDRVLAYATLHSGTTANRTPVYNLTVFAGGVANKASVSGGFTTMYISSGGIANETVVNISASLYVYHGGAAYNTVVSGGGHMYISSGGTANGTIVSADYQYNQGWGILGFLDVFNGGVVNSTTLDKGILHVSSGGAANETTANYGGDLHVSNGGTANSTTVNSGGDLYVSNGGTVNSTTVNSGGKLYVYSGGAATEILENGGYVDVAAGANATFVANSLCGLVLSSLATLHSVTTANSTTVNSGGWLFVHSGGTANETVMNGGWLTVSNGGLANGVTVNSDGSMYVGGVANSTTVYSGGSMFVDGTANSTAVNNGGTMYVRSGTANSITVNRGGFLSVCKGPTATIVYNPWQGSISYESGATVTYLERDAKVYYGGNNGLIDKGDILSSFTVSSGHSALIYSGGTVNSATVNNHGYLYVSSGGTVNSATVNNYSYLRVSSGGTAIAATVNSSGIVNVGGVANETTVNSGGIVNVDGVANETTVNNSGRLYIFAGGTANSTTVNSYDDSHGIIFGNMYVSKGGTANATTVAGGMLWVFSGGTANSTVVNSGGQMRISSGGTAIETTVDNYGYLHVSGGGMIDSTTVGGSGNMYISSGGTANSTTVNSYGSMYVSNGASALAIRENGGYVEVADGASATFAANSFSGLALSGASATLHSGTTANSTTVNSSGYMYVYYGGVANDAAVSSKGLIVLYGGTANSTTVNISGFMHVRNGGEANSATVNRGGNMYVSSGGTANETTVSSKGRITVLNGGTANSITVSGGSLYVSNGGTANATAVNSGGSIRLDGGTANLTAVNSGGSMYVSSGGTANSTTVNCCGSMYIYSGGVATGVLTITSGATVSAYEGSVIDFDISAVAAGDAPRINDLSLVQGAPAFSVTVSEAQEMGSYSLAGGAAGFDQSATIKTDAGTQLGTLTVDGNISFGDYICSLVLADGVLSLTIYDPTLATQVEIFENTGARVSAATVITGETLDATQYLMLVHSGGTANSTTVNSSGYMYVSSGGVANETTVNRHGCMYVYSGGVASGIALDAGGMLTVCSGGSVHVLSDNRFSGAVLSGGTLWMEPKAAISDTAVSSGGIISVGASASAKNVAVHSGGVVTRMNASSYWYVLTDLKVYSGGSAHYLYTGGATLAGGNTYFASGTLDNYRDAYTDGNGYLRNFGCTGAFAIKDGMKIDDFTAKGHLYMLGNAVARNVSFVSARYMSVLGGDYLYNASCSVVMQSALIGCSGTSLGGANTTIAASGGLTYCNPTNRSSTNAVKDADIDISNGVITGMTLVDSGLWLKDITLCEGIMASAPVISYGGSLHMGSGGTVFDAVVYSSGVLQVSSGGVANETAVNSGGCLYVFSGGSANRTAVNSGGYLYVSSGGTVNETAVSGNVYSRRYGSMCVFNGGVANLTAVNSYGIMSVSNGGVAKSTTVNRNGYLYVYRSGVANFTTVNSGGRLIVSSGGKITGLLTLADGAWVSAYAGGIIDFDVSRTSSGDAARVNDLSLIRGTPDFTVTVSANQAPGEYRLADGAAGFDMIITVDTDTATLGTLSVGETITVSNVDYSLKLADGALSLGVAFKVEPSNVAESLTSAAATQVYGTDLAAKWTSDTAAGSTVALVSSDFGGNAWLDLEGANLSDTTLYGAEEAFNGTVNIFAASGAVLGNLAAGAASGGTVGGVKLTVDDAALGKTYVGGFGNVTGTAGTLIRGGSMTKDLYAGALANYAKTNTVTGAGDMKLDIESGTFSGNIYGAASVKAGSATTLVHSAGNVTINVKGGETTKGGEACLFAGGYATGSTDSKVYTVGSISTAIEGGSWGTAKSGRGVFGGIFASKVTAEAGDINLTVSGGSMGNVYGGGWAQKNGTSIVGDVKITIAGGTIANVFGGGSHSTSGGNTEAGDVNITVSGGNITGAVYARGQLDGDIVDSAEVVFTGDTNFSCGIYGYSYAVGAASDATLSFSGYTGTFSGKIGGFDCITLDASTAMTLTTAAADVSNSVWNFDVSARDAGLSDTALLDWNNADFAGGTITLNVAAGSTSAWTLVEAAATAYGVFEVRVDSVSQGTLELGEKLQSGDFAGWGFAAEDSVLKFKQLA